MKYRDEVKNVRREGMWSFWYLIPSLLVVGVTLMIIGFVINMLSRPAQVVSRVTQPDRIIQNYEWFEEAYNDALAIDRQIRTALTGVESFEMSVGKRSEWSREDKIEHSRLSAIVLGLRNQRDDIVSEYNTKSKSITRNLFKGSELPYQLRVEDDSTMEVWAK